LSLFSRCCCFVVPFKNSESKSGYLTGKISIADVKLWCFVKMVSGVAPLYKAIEGINTSVITSQFSRIQALVDKIDALPAVKKYYGGK